MKDLEELKDLAQNAKQNIDFYAELYEDVDIDEIESFDDFRQEVPVIDKGKLLEFYEDGSFNLDARNVENPIIARPTSGTTSDMAIYYRTRQEIVDHCERFMEATDHYFEGGKNKDRALVATTFSLLPILSREFLEKGCMVTSGSPFDIDRTAEVFKSMKCNTLVCSPPVALKVSEKLREKGYDGLEKYYFVSSGLSSPTETRLRELYPKAEIMLQYGLAETGILMKQCRHLKGTNRYHLFGDDKPFHYEFLDEEGEEVDDGEIGSIVVTKFNDKTPLIRYSVGDMFEKKGECECREKLFKFAGRRSDKFKVHGVTVFKERIEEALEQVMDRIQQYQVVLDEEEDSDMPKTKIILRVEMREGAEDQREEIGGEFARSFEVADDYTWRKGVEMDIFAPVEVEPVEFEDRKYKKIEDQRYD